MDKTASIQQSWTFGIMCYNEIGSLETVVRNIADTAPEFTSDFEILIVDDGSTDGSKEKTLELAERYEYVKCILHETNQGIGATLRSIYLNATKENVANLPGDGQFKANEYLKITHVPDDSFVAFYRKENMHYSLLRNGLSLVNYILNRYFIGFICKDVNWTKVYKTKDIQKLQLSLESSLIETEIGAKLKLMKKRIIELESVYHERKHGVSKGAKLSVVLAAAKEIIKLKYELIRFKKSVLYR